MDIYSLLKNRRTVRRFSQKKIDDSLLEKMVDMARLAPSGANLQPVKYIIVNEKENVDKILPHVKWAAYLKEEGAPKNDECPTAFICVLIDKNITQNEALIEIGAACQSIFLIGEEEGIGSCWMGAINRAEIAKIIELPENLVINTVIALGYKAETPSTTEFNGDVKYYKDENGTLNVPKRALSEVLVKKL